ncbi:MAG: FAD synthetase family protein [Spirochaetales bacterium]|nr:FAD synthetase family protein [Spirochaetales bacterium]
MDSSILKDTDIVVAIGVFDGVHLGHSKIFSALKEEKIKQKAKGMVITFDRNPKQQEAGSLDTMRLRREYVESFDIDFFVVIDFSSDFSKISGSEFIRLLCTMSRIKTVIVGEDFKCGNPKARITAKELEGEFTKHGSNTCVNIVNPVLDDEGIRISSTNIRKLILQGRMERVTSLSGKNYELDLKGIEPKREQAGIAYASFSILQMLPKKGRYKSEALMEDGRVFKTVLTVTDDCIYLEGMDEGHIETLRIITKE